MSVPKFPSAATDNWTPNPPASADVLRSLSSRIPYELPSDYVAFLRTSNGGYGDLPMNPWYCELWPAESLADYNRDYEVSLCCAGFFGFGTSGGGEMFAFDARGPQPWPVVIVPFIGMEPSVALPLAPDFLSFTASLGHQSNVT
jgi:SMI1 / KNR4 family (SUKH-1)